MVAAVSDAVEESSVDAQELTPSVRTDTRTRMSRKYLRKLKMDIILLHEGIKNLNYSVSIILPNQSLIFLRTIDLCLPFVKTFILFVEKTEEGQNDE